MCVTRLLLYGCWTGDRNGDFGEKGDAGVGAVEYGDKEGGREREGEGEEGTENGDKDEAGVGGVRK